MIDIYNAKAADLLPDNLKSDADFYNMMLALDHYSSVQLEKIKRLGLLQRDDWTDEETDELAWRFHVDYYDPTLPLEQKRDLVRKSISIHKRKGTASAVEDLVDAVFGYGVVEEWYSYGDDPGYFQVIVNNPAATNEQAAQFIALVDSVKRKSAHLRRVALIEYAKNTTYVGIAGNRAKIATLRQVN